MADLDRLEQDLRAACLAHVAAVEQLVWGHPIFKVAGKIFCGFERQGAVLVVVTKLTPDEQGLALADPDVSVAPYVGRHGWIATRITRRAELGKLRAFIARSYDLVAPRSRRREPARGATRSTAKSAGRPARQRSRARP
jgi:predicted DNA-binding protein (MmcQ/YjbR family)